MSEEEEEENQNRKPKPSSNYTKYPGFGKGMRIFGAASLVISILSVFIAIVFGLYITSSMQGVGSLEEILALLQSSVFGSLVISAPFTIASWGFLGFFLFKIYIVNIELQNERLRYIFYLLIASSVVSILLMIIGSVVLKRTMDDIEILILDVTLDIEDIAAMSEKINGRTALTSLGGLMPIVLDIGAYITLHNWAIGQERLRGIEKPAYGEGISVVLGVLTKNTKKIVSGEILIIVASILEMIPVDWLSFFTSIISIVGFILIGIGLYRTGIIIETGLSTL